MEMPELLKKTARTLYFSAQILPEYAKDTFSAAYLLCRAADSVADTGLVEQKEKLGWIAAFAQMIEERDIEKMSALSALIAPKVTNAEEKELLLNLPACAEVYHAQTGEHKKIIMDVVKSVCEGMVFDMNAFPAGEESGAAALKTEAELDKYCGYMGGAPGVFWSRLILGNVKVKMRDDEFVRTGENIGKALQITNIIRDAAQDLKIGRCYFPEEDLDALGLNVKDLSAGNQAAAKALASKWIKYGADKLEGAYKYFSSIPKKECGMRAAVALPVLWSLDTLSLLADNAADIFDPAKRVKMSKFNLYFTLFVRMPETVITNFSMYLLLLRKMRKIRKKLSAK
ncbi:farnesyl-diphosphate farnesyltransferase [Parelusimicrobium proximum]|uniref:phytoene/squalene synthase family protein n=1 Tax=Parelusimicrobium proximum TaxID=3228953 RepID=UPI003D1647A8